MNIIVKLATHEKLFLNSYNQQNVSYMTAIYVQYFVRILKLLISDINKY